MRRFKEFAKQSIPSIIASVLLSKYYLFDDQLSAKPTQKKNPNTDNAILTPRTPSKYMIQK
jgi:hypothetical protein